MSHFKSIKQRPKSDRSLYLEENENEALIKAIESSNCVSLATSIAQLCIEKDGIWEKTHTGIVCYVKDYHVRSFFLRIYNLNNEVLWQYEILMGFDFQKLTDNFYYFTYNDHGAGLNFSFIDEAQKLNEAIMQNSPLKEAQIIQETPSNVAPEEQNILTSEASNKRESKSLSLLGDFFFGKAEKKQEKKIEISAPTDFKHVSGFSKNRLFIDPNDPNMQNMLSHILAHFNLDANNANKQLIIEFASSKGGIQKLTEELEKEKLVVDEKQQKEETVYVAESFQRPNVRPPPIPDKTTKPTSVAIEKEEIEAKQSTNVNSEETDEIAKRRDGFKNRKSIAFKRKSTVRAREPVENGNLTTLTSMPESESNEKAELNIQRQLIEPASSGSVLSDITSGNFKLKKTSVVSSEKEKIKEDIKTGDEEMVTDAPKSVETTSNGSFLSDIANGNFKLKKREKDSGDTGNKVGKILPPILPKNESQFNVSEKKEGEQKSEQNLIKTEDEKKNSLDNKMGRSFLDDIANRNFTLNKANLNEKRDDKTTTPRCKTMQDQFKEFLKERRRFFEDEENSEDEDDNFEREFNQSH